MIEFGQALKIVLSHAERVGTETVSLEDACGRFLAQNIAAPCDLPPFDKSAVDGYACRREDVLKMSRRMPEGNTSGGALQEDGLQLRLLEVIPAGSIGANEVVEGTCSKIMTGAPLPMGADMVLMVEQCVEFERPSHKSVGDGFLVGKGEYVRQSAAESSAESSGNLPAGNNVFVRLREDSSSVEKLASKSNTCLRGEDVAFGAVLLRSGHFVRPQDVAVIATCGLSQVLVHRRIKVGIISTGSELLEPGSVEPVLASDEGASSNSDGGAFQQVGTCSSAGQDILPTGTCVAAGHDILPTGTCSTSGSDYLPTGTCSSAGFYFLPSGKIFNSNSWQLLSLLRNMGAEASYYGIAPDTREETQAILSRAVADNQLVLLSGGVSEGDFDFVPSVMRELGFEILFSRVAVQPGKPTTFAVGGGKYIFGLPGNPVSAFVQTLLLVKPLLVNMQGGEYSERLISMPIAGEYSRHNAERTAHIPVMILYDGTCMPVEYHGSAHISALCEADGLLRIPLGVTHFDSGDKVQVMLF